MARPKQYRLLVVVTVAWALWATWSLLTGESSIALTVVDEDGTPVPGATLAIGGDQVAVTDQQGTVTVEPGQMLELSAPGYHTTALWVGEPPPDGHMLAQLDPWLLRGVVLDEEGRPVPGVKVRADGREAATDEQGYFVVKGAGPGPVEVRKPAWEEVDFGWDGSPGKRTIEIGPRVVRAVHVTGEVAGDPTRWQEFLEMAETTELNGIMLDLKDEYGLVYYQTEVELAQQVGAAAPHYNLGELVRQTDERDLYLIGRIVTFQDPIAARAVPEMAVGNRNTGGVFSKNGHYFLDPTDPDARQYGLDLAEEACRLGVDEVQFDYIRYPDGFGEAAVFDQGSDQKTRVAAVRSFLEQARALLNPMGCAVAGDIFGFVTTATDDGGIGQQWEMVTSVLDVVSPMVYPSHYGAGWYGFENPNDHPGPMVRHALRDGIDRLESATVIRPWLQDFGYDARQVRAQIEAAESFGLGWMLWNAESRVTTEALEPAGSGE